MKLRFALLLLVLVYGCSVPESVDLIVHNATIYSVNPAMEVHEAMAIKDGKIIAIGPENQILNKYQCDQSIDAHKRAIFPGFIDAHCHFLKYGLQARQVDLVGTRSFEEMMVRIAMFAETDTSRWIIGRGWDQNDWEDQSYPTNDTLSVLFPDRFIVMKRIDGHAALVSDNVLERAGFTIESYIEGGALLQENGELTGVLIDEAVTPIDSLLPQPDHDKISEALMAAQKNCLEVGLTTVDDAGLSAEEVGIVKRLQEEGRLKMRIYAMLSASPDIMNSLETLKYKSAGLNVRSVKVYADGSLGSRGAYLLQPYSDDPSTKGLLITPADSIVKWAKACVAAGMQLNVHCIGDQANRITLDAMGSVLKGTNDLRWRIEHAQVVSPRDIKKFAAFNIIPSVQPMHATSDMYWAEKRLGKRRTFQAYSYKSLLEQNGLIALGTDFPVEDIDPVKTFYAAVFRRDAAGYPAKGYHIDQALSREEAIRGMTIWAAIANFEEGEKGSLEIGKFADFVVLENDIMTCKEEDILQTRVLQTWINGKLVYEY